MKNNIYYQPKDTEKHEIPSFAVWLSKEECMTDTGISLDEIIELNWEDIENPTFMADDDTIALWTMENVDRTLEVFGPDDLAGYKLFCVGPQMIQSIKHKNGITLKVYASDSYDLNDLNDNCLVDILNYPLNDELFEDLNLKEIL